MPEVSSSVDILVCEHSVTDAELMLEGLRFGHPEYRIHLVRDTVEAIRYLARKPPYVDVPRPHVVILNQDLPGNGKETLLKTLRCESDTHGIQVVLLADASADPSSGNSDGTFIKPVELDEFFVMIQQIRRRWSAGNVSQSDES